MAQFGDRYTAGGLHSRMWRSTPTAASASVIAGLPDRKKLHGLLEGRTALPAPPDAATAARALSRQQRKFGNDLLKRPLP